MPSALDQLNPEQRAAAEHTEGPLLILAGAGTGKTRVLVHRVAHLLETGAARPHEILAVTFTNRAAGEMRSRIETMVGPAARRAWIGTFHSMCGRILRLEGHRLGYNRQFSIYDQQDSLRVLKRCLETAGHPKSDISPQSIASEIDRAKNLGLSPEAFLSEIAPFDTPTRRIARGVYPKYQAALRAANAVDFGDMLLLTVELFKCAPEVCAELGQRFRYVMVDEFQDTNQVQYQLLRKLVAPHQNLAVVGDDDQSIYRWRGAQIKNILEFPQIFPDAEVVRLEQNYRSTGNILRAANAVIAQNQRRHGKRLRTEAGDGDPLGVALFQHADDEAQMVAQIITQRIRGGSAPEDFAILYRQNAQSRIFEETLRRFRVPYVVLGGTGFYERAEVKDLLAYLRMIVNPRSTEDFLRVVNVPGRGIGQKTLSQLQALSEQEERPGAEVLSLGSAALERAGITKRAVRQLEVFAERLAAWTALADDDSPDAVLRAIISDTRYLAHLEKKDPATFEDRSANVEELVSSVAEFEPEADEASEAASPLERFLEQAALSSTQDVDTDHAVRLLTLHAAKGLEFPCAFIVGLEEGTFPSRRAAEGDEDDLEEERRLFYVGITRAEKTLFLSAARYRRIYGREELRLPSRFLAELPEAVVGPMVGTQAGHTSPATIRVPEEERVFRVDPGEDPFAVGRAVHHNTFGRGRIEARDGAGAQARLTIRFQDAGTKRVIARFVSPAAG